MTTQKRWNIEGEMKGGLSGKEHSRTPPRRVCNWGFHYSYSEKKKWMWEEALADIFMFSDLSICK